MPEYIYGHWAVLETLRAGRRPVETLLLAERVDEKGIVSDIVEAAKARGVRISRVKREIMDDLASGANHQSTMLRAGTYPYTPDVDDLLTVATEREEKPFLLLLDLLQDPQNVGALLRVADAVGVHGVIMQERRSVGVTPSVVNASSGAVEHLRVVQVTNLVNAMKDLKKQDVWLVGLDMGAELSPVDQPDLNMALGIVLGSEGEGMRRLVRDTCDLLLTLPMRGNVASLNVSTVGSVALYTAWRARNWEGWARA